MFKSLITLLFVAFSHNALAQTDLIFKSGMEFVNRLNDTGLTWAGEYPSGNNGDCTSTTITSSQDCHTGRDVTHNDDIDGHAGFSFTKLNASGVPLADQSVSYESIPWACVRDNITGLVWEIKTTTTGIHHKDNTYKWGGLSALGRNHPDRLGAYYDDWNTLVQGSNDEALCGFDNWRVATVSELTSITNKGTSNPSIDSNYFPNTVSSEFWSSSPIAGGVFVDNAWIVYFDFSYDNINARDNDYRVRLVHSTIQ